MIYGVKAGDNVVLTNAQNGKPIIATEPPSIPDGYMADYSWNDDGSQITQVWHLFPIEGTAQDSILELAKMQAQSLSDAEAVRVPALYDEWIAGETYKRGKIVRFKGELYRIGQDLTSSDTYKPGDEGTTALYSHIAIDSETNYEVWKEWDGVSGIYSQGQIVKDSTDNALYRSKIANNVWGPPSSTPDYWEKYNG